MKTKQLIVLIILFLILSLSYLMCKRVYGHDYEQGYNEKNRVEEARETAGGTPPHAYFVATLQKMGS